MALAISNARIGLIINISNYRKYLIIHQIKGSINANMYMISSR